MIQVNRIGDRISGTYVKVENGKTVTVDYNVLFKNDDQFNEMLAWADQAATIDTMSGYADILENFLPYTIVSTQEVIATASEYLVFNPEKGMYFLKTKDDQDNDVITSVPIPQGLVDRILISVEKNIPVSPLVKLWTRWLRNTILRGYELEDMIDFSRRFVNYVNNMYVDQAKLEALVESEGISREAAEKRLSRYQVEITQEGLLSTFKVSKEIFTKYVLDEDEEAKLVSRYKKEIDEETGLIKTLLPETAEERVFQPAIMDTRGNSFSCGTLGEIDPKEGHVIKVGRVHKLAAWSMVNTNNHVVGAPGLHVGNLDYIRGYQADGTETHNVFVDPMYIGAIPNDVTGAIRCLAYFVHSTFSGVNGAIYHPSKYAAQNDVEWSEQIQEITKMLNLSDADQTKFLTEVNSLK